MVRAAASPTGAGVARCGAGGPGAVANDIDCQYAYINKYIYIYISKLSRNLARIDFGLNLDFIVFTFYLSGLLIGNGFVTGVPFRTHLSNVNFI